MGERGVSSNAEGWAAGYHEGGAAKVYKDDELRAGTDEDGGGGRSHQSAPFMEGYGALTPAQQSRRALYDL